MDRDMGQNLQANVSRSMGEYEQQLSQLGMQSANMLSSRANQEGQFTSMDAQAAGYAFEGKKSGLDREMAIKMNTATTIKDLNLMIGQQDMVQEKEKVAAAARDDQMILAGRQSYVKMMQSHPPISAAEKYAMLLNYRSMPNSNFLFSAKQENLPNRHEQADQEKINQMKKLYAGNSNLTDEEHLQNYYDRQWNI